MNHTITSVIVKSSARSFKKYFLRYFVFYVLLCFNIYFHTLLLFLLNSYGSTDSFFLSVEEIKAKVNCDLLLSGQITNEL